MKRLCAVGAVLATLLLAGPAASASPSPSDKKVAALQKQVTLLTKQVTQLKADVKFLKNESNANYEGDACLAGLTASTFQGTWQTIDTKQTSGSPWFDATQASTPISDHNSCKSLIGAKPSIDKPPALNIFDDMIRWILGLP